MLRVALPGANGVRSTLRVGSFPSSPKFAMDDPDVPKACNLYSKHILRAPIAVAAEAAVRVGDGPHTHDNSSQYMNSETGQTFEPHGQHNGVHALWPRSCCVPAYVWSHLRRRGEAERLRRRWWYSRRPCAGLRSRLRAGDRERRLPGESSNKVSVTARYPHSHPAEVKKAASH